MIYYVEYDYLVCHGSRVKCKIAKILANCSPYFTALQHINNLETKRSYKRKVNLKNLKF